MGKSLGNLAVLFHAQGKYAEAKRLIERSVAILEKSLGPEHPLVGQSLENYATLLRKTGYYSEAAKQHARAKAIQAKHAPPN